MHLTVVDQTTESVRPTVCVVSKTPARVDRNVTGRPAMGQDPDFRHSRVTHLREALAAGTYSITAEQVAAKMLGRAICDQVAHLVDVL